jgi:beta-lactamase regulating signal transducer with metallopeptidase domain
MVTLLDIGLGNALAASLLALVAAAGTRLGRSPAVAHGLWLLVFVKLASPPLVAVPFTWEAPRAVAVAPPNHWEQPALSLVPSPAPDRAAVAARLRALEEAVPEADASLPMLTLAQALACLWLCGSSVWFGWTALVLWRFHRLLRHSLPVPVELKARLELLARRLGVRCPALVLLPGQLSPMVWCFFGRPRLLFPAGLLERIDSAQTDTLLLHELAHISRRDHWVRWLEVVVSGIYWWLPVVWLARRGLHAAEEECCDARVLRLLPDARRDYAQALVRTLTFLSSSRTALPAMASGVGAVPELKRRLTMILRTRPTSAWTSCVGAAALVCAALVLPWAPALAQPAAEEQPSARQSRQEQIELLRSLLKTLEEQQKGEAKTSGKTAAQALYTKQLEAATRAYERAFVAQALAGQNQANPASGDEPRKAEAQHLRAAVAAAQADLDRATAQVQVAQAQLREAEARLKRLELDMLRAPKADPKARGKITRISSTDKALVSISIGSDAGLKEGDVLDVYHLEPKAEHLGKLRLVMVEANAAVGRLQGSAQGQIRLGDQVGPTLGDVTFTEPRQGKATAISPDGKLLATAEGNMVRIWDAATGKILSQSDQGRKVVGVAFSPDRKRLATGGDRSVALWDVPTGQQTRMIQLGTDVAAIRFSPDGKLLIVVSTDNRERQFDIATGKEVTQVGN